MNERRVQTMKKRIEGSAALALGIAGTGFDGKVRYTVLTNTAKKPGKQMWREQPVSLDKAARMLAFGGAIRVTSSPINRDGTFGVINTFTDPF